MIQAPVGRKSTNNLEDVRTVQKLLNGFINAKRLGVVPYLAVDGNAQSTIPYIETFQKDIVGFDEPDGSISPGGVTWVELTKHPDDMTAYNMEFTMVQQARQRTPLDTIKPDLWRTALESLTTYLGDTRLHKPWIVTFLDFRISRQEQRLWTVNIRDHVLLFKTWVAHGKPNNGNYQHDFRDGDYRTALGPYITDRLLHSSKLGYVSKKEPMTKVHGLIKHVNGRSYNRGIAFHAAKYVKPNDVDNSEGCFATPIDHNRQLIPLIAFGTFAYAFYTA
jgi:hypothetical protein